MFEKEAEEYQIKKHHQRLYGHKPVVMKELNTTFKEGAEFGYNKALEEQGDKIESAYREGVAFGKDKLKDEWHYVKDGDLPTDNKEVLVYMWDSFYIGYYNLKWHFDCFSEESEQVTAWKEIVPPDIEEE